MAATLAEERLGNRKEGLLANVVTLATGSVIAQLIALASAPLVTRLFGPEVYGLLGIFLSLGAVLVPLSTLAYSQAVAFPKSELEAQHLMWLSIGIATALALMILPVLLLFAEQISLTLGAETAIPALWLLSPLVFFGGTQQTASQYLVRQRKFRTVSLSDSSQSAVAAALKVTWGLLSPSALVLVVSTVSARFVHAIGLLGGVLSLRRSGPVTFDPLSLATLRAVASKYKDFPLFRAPQNFLNALSRNLPIVILGSLFGPAIAGHYALGHRVLQLPIALLSQAIGRAMLPRLAARVHRSESLGPTLWKSTAVLAAVGIVPFGVVVAFGPDLFGFVFGSDWVIAGRYARWLSVWLYFGFVDVPAVQVLPFVQAQRFLLIWEIVSSALKVTVLVVAALAGMQPVVAVAGYSLVGAVAYVVLIAVSYAKVLQGRYRELEASPDVTRGG